jgi:phosphoribosylglycinamide formyltransferase-1
LVRKDRTSKRKPVKEAFHMSDVLPIGVLASGRGSNLQAIIDAIEGGELDADLRVVLSDVENAVALERARKAGVPAVFVDAGRKGARLSAQAEKEYVKCLQVHAVELVILAGFMRILGDELLEAFEGRIMNIHPSLLPSFPGLNAQHQAFEHGVKVAGCSVHFVDAGVDTGPIVLQQALEVMENDDAESLAARILEQEHKIYPRAIQLFAEGRLRIEGRRVKVLPRRDQPAEPD